MTTRLTRLARPPRLTRKGLPDRRGTIAKSLANLKPPYKPGENGHGRVYPLKERLQHALDHPLKEPKPDAPAGEQLVYATLKAAIEIVPVAFREAWDRTEGKVPDKTAIVGDILIKVVYEERVKIIDESRI